MLPNMTSSPRKPTRLLYATLATLATLALLVIASPGRAADPQRSQPLQQGFTSTTNSTTGMRDTLSDDIGNQDQPDTTCPPGGQCFADVPSSNPFYASVNPIYL